MRLPRFVIQIPLAASCASTWRDAIVLKHKLWRWGLKRKRCTDEDYKRVWHHSRLERFE
jgi:hypothetical protein